MTVDVAASVKAKLLARARTDGEEFERTLVRYASERLLYRLGASSVRERCLVKGASLLSVWLPDPYRATRDIDLLAFGASDEAAVRSLIEEVCAVPCAEDGLSFDLSELSVETIRPEEEYPGSRARFLAHLGTARIHIQVDVGYGDSVGAECEEIEYPVLLDHLPAPRLRAYPKETTVAEKFEAMVKLDIRNSRMKDFHDIWALSGSFVFEGLALRQAVAGCFERRGTPWTRDVPLPLTPAFYQMTELEARWSAYLAAGAVLAPPPAQFAKIGERIIRFLAPLRESVFDGQPFGRHWPEGGPWQADEAGRVGIVQGGPYVP